MFFTNVRTAPEELYTTSDNSVFLAGTIEQGNSVDWQKEVAKQLNITNLTVYNPRRKDWNAKATQSSSDEYFTKQVVWEQKAIELCNYILFNFLPDTVSKISMLELGQALILSKYEEKTIIVSCPPEFVGHGNISLMCAMYNIPLYSTIDDAVNHLKVLLTKSTMQ